MTNQSSERDQRHYKRMLEAIPRSWDMASLASLIATLDFLLESVEACDSDWKNRFRKQWGVLEEVNALVLDEGRTTFTVDEQQLLNHAVKELKALIEEAQQAVDN